MRRTSLFVGDNHKYALDGYFIMTIQIYVLFQYVILRMILNNIRLGYLKRTPYFLILDIITKF